MKRKQPSPKVSIGSCVLAGGLSSRMGRDKAKLRFGDRSLLGHLRAVAKRLGLPVRVIRRDLVPHCGPLGGIYTALKTSRADAEIFLACDMPFVSEELLAKVIKRLSAKCNGVFVAVKDVVGFPFLIRTAALPLVERQIRREQFSLQALAKALDAHLLTLPPKRDFDLFNINTPEELDTARRLLANR